MALKGGVLSNPVKVLHMNNAGKIGLKLLNVIQTRGSNPGFTGNSTYCRSTEHKINYFELKTIFYIIHFI